jgi:hypothetical protein
MADTTTPTADDMVDGIYRDLDQYLDQAAEHLVLQTEVLFNRLTDTRKAGEIPADTADDLDLVVQALACIERAREELATRKEREAFTREAFAVLSARGEDDAS